MNLLPIQLTGPVEVAGLELPELVGDVVSATRGLYERRGFEPPWLGFLAIEEGCIVGTCGFAGPPRDGEVEIAYFTFPGKEGQGIATRMATELIRLAGEATAEVCCTAHTLPHEGASTSILRKLKFHLLGEVEHPEDGIVWKWRR
jgi:RimJ/RimL family protein N-acetyltransferase